VQDMLMVHRRDKGCLTAGVCQELALYSTTQSGFDLRDVALPTRCNSSLAAVALGSKGHICMNTRRNDFSMLALQCAEVLTKLRS
jgi:hypothetical protein